MELYDKIIVILLVVVAAMAGGAFFETDKSIYGAFAVFCGLLSIIITIEASS